MLRIGSIVWGVRDMQRGIAFWTAALGYRPQRVPDDDWAILVPISGEGPQLALKLVTSPAARRHHLDLYTDDRHAEVKRLLALGAQSAQWHYEADADYIVLADPNGNRFCVIEKK